MLNERQLHEELVTRVSELHQAETDLRVAMEKAIDAKVRLLLTQAHLIEARKGSERERLKLMDRARFLGGNKKNLSSFVRAPLDDSWRRRVIGI